jgi:hypothetical protein
MNIFVKDAMTTKVIWVEQDTRFAAIAAALRPSHVRAQGQAPFGHGHGQPPGRDRQQADVLAVYDRPNLEIGEEIRNDIAVRESRADAGRFDVTVTDGVVTLIGRPRTCKQGHAIVRRARHVQGVVAVRDRLDYPPPARVPSTSCPAFAISRDRVLPEFVTLRRSSNQR